MRHQRLLPLLLGLTAVSAEAAEPIVRQLSPQGVRRGGVATVELIGPRLGDDPAEVVFYDGGVSVTALERVAGDRVRATLDIAADTAIGRHALRLRTETGLSNLVTLHVGALEVLDEVEPNNTLEAAQPAPLDRTIQGVVKAEDEDLFSFEVAEGERFSVEVEGIRLGRTFFDPVIEVLDESGALLAANDDQAAAHQDAFVSLLAPKAGRLFVRLRETAYRGNDQSTYLLHVGRFPRPQAVFPPATVAGQPTEVRWIGGPTDGATQAIDSAGAAVGATAEAIAADEAGVATSSLPLSVLAAAPAQEAEPNDNRKKEANAVAAPGAAAGVVQAENDRDCFVASLKKGQTLDARVRARELRSTLDPVLRVFDANGKRLTSNDDDRGFADSYLRFKAPEDGEYVFEVADRFNRGGPAFVYLLDLAAPQPVAEITIDERRRYEATTIETPRGGRTAVLLKVTRRDFGGELEAFFDSLPAGVRAESFPLAGDYNAVPVVLHAEAEAPLAATLSPVSVRLTGSDASKPIESRLKQQTWFVRGRNNVPMWSHFAERAPIAVTQRLPFSITLAQPEAPLCRDGSIELRVAAERDEGFDQPIRVYTLYHPPGVSSNRSRSVPKGETAVTIPVTANNNARTGDWPMVVVGETSVNGRVYVASQFVMLSVAEPYFDLSVPTLTTLQGQEVEMTVPLSHRTAYEGDATLELVGLPPGVTAPAVQAVAGTESATFKVSVADDAKPGRHRGVGVRVRLPLGADRVEYRQGYAELRIDPKVEPRTAQQSPSTGDSAT